MAAAWAPALALFGLWVRANLVAPSEAEAPLGTLSAGLGARYQAPADALGALTLSLQGFIKRTLVDDIAAIGLLALGVLGLIGVLVQAARGRDRGALAAALACGGVALTALLLYLFMPQHIQGQYYLSTRMAPWIPLALAPLVALVPVPGWARWARLGATGGLAALALGGVGFAFSTFASEAAPVDRLLAQVEPEKRLMLWAGTRSSRALPSNPFTHYLSWTAAETGGTTTFSFASWPNPVVYRDRDAAQRSIPGEEFKAWCTAFAGQAQDVDYVVTRGADKAPRKLCNATPLRRPAGARGGGRRVGAVPGDGAPAGGEGAGLQLPVAAVGRSVSAPGARPPAPPSGPRGPARKGPRRARWCPRSAPRWARAAGSGGPGPRAGAGRRAGPTCGGPG